MKLLIVTDEDSEVVYCDKLIDDIKGQIIDMLKNVGHYDDQGISDIIPDFDAMIDYLTELHSNWWTEDGNYNFKIVEIDA